MKEISKNFQKEAFDLSKISLEIKKAQRSKNKNNDIDIKKIIKIQA
jgi:hypothetical protein